MNSFAVKPVYISDRVSLFEIAFLGDDGKVFVFYNANVGNKHYTFSEVEGIILEREINNSIEEEDDNLEEYLQDFFLECTPSIYH